MPVGQKIAYGIGSANDMWGNWLYPSLVWPVFNIFLLVSPGLVSLALMINRLLDAVSDPVFGWLSDNARTRWGRRRPFILVGSILAGVCLPGLFMVGRDWTEMSYFWFMVVSSGVYITIVSCFNMPWQSLGAELTPDYHERTSVYAFKSGVQKVPEIALFLASAFVTASFFNDPETGEPDILLGARVYTAILGAVMIVVGIVVFAGVKERYYGKLVARKQERVLISDTVWRTLRCRPFRAQLAMALSYGMGTSMVGTLGYYTTVYYVCQGDVAAGSKWNFAMGLSGMIMGLSGIPVFAAIARRLGKRKAMMCVQLSAMGAFLATWWLYTPGIPWLQVGASGSIAFTGAGFWVLYGSIGADVMDYDELESGKRREGAFSACASWIMKVGMAVGIGISGWILQAAGFDAALGGAQDPQTLWWIRVLLAAIPIVGLVIALMALKAFGLTPERMHEIRTQLEARRGEV